MKKVARAKRARSAKRPAPRKKPIATQPAITVTRSAVPYLVIRDCARAIDFYKRAFGAIETVRLDDPGSGKIAHCEIKIGDAVIFLADEWEGVGAKSPSSLGGCPVIIHLEVDDVDAIAKRAIDAGAKVIFPVQNQFYGARSGRLQDPFGHMWLLSMNIENVSDREMRRREAEWFKHNAEK